MKLFKGKPANMGVISTIGLVRVYKQMKRAIWLIEEFKDKTPIHEYSLTKIYGENFFNDHTTHVEDVWRNKHGMAMLANYFDGVGITRKDLGITRYPSNYYPFLVPSLTSFDDIFGIKTGTTIEKKDKTKYTVHFPCKIKKII